MNQAFLTGIVGIQTHQYGIDIVADNISNINTVGFKAARAEFSSLFESALSTLGGPTSDSIGLGSRLSATSMVEHKGTMLPSDKTTSLAIDGEGWFGISRGDETFYTRTGNFLFDANRNLVTNDGYFVRGTMGGNISNGVLTEVIDSVTLNENVTKQELLLPGELTFPGEVTTVANFGGNLGVDPIQRLVSAEVISPDYERNRLSLRFIQTVPQPTLGTSWDVTATVSDPTGTTVYDTQTGTALFGGDGAFISHNIPVMNNQGTPVTVNLGSGYDGLIAIDGNTSGNLYSTSDGSTPGNLVDYQVSQSGDVIVAFDNGRQSAVAKIALYHFQNDQGLERITGTRFRESANSGGPILYFDEAGNSISSSKILNNALESSNVKLETAMTELIIMQRAYDANAKSITTGDELIQKALQMDA